MLHLNKEERCGSILTCSSEDGQDYDTPGATKISGPWRMRKCKHMTSFWLWQLDRCLFVLFIGHQLVWTCWGGGLNEKRKLCETWWEKLSEEERNVALHDVFLLIDRVFGHFEMYRIFGFYPTTVACLGLVKKYHISPNMIGFSISLVLIAFIPDM